MEIFGIDYIADFIELKQTERNERLAYQYYMAEAFRLYGENKRLTIRLQDIIEPQAVKPEKTVEQVEADIFAEFDRLGVKKKDGGER